MGKVIEGVANLVQESDCDLRRSMVCFVMWNKGDLDDEEKRGKVWNFFLKIAISKCLPRVKQI